MTEFNTILVDRILSKTVSGTIEVDSPVTFTQPVNIPGGVGEQTISVDTIKPFTPGGDVTVTTGLVVQNGKILTVGEISSPNASINIDKNLELSTAASLGTNTITSSSGSNINCEDNFTVTAGNKLFVDSIDPLTTTFVNFDLNVKVNPSGVLQVNTIEASSGSNIGIPGGYNIQMLGAANSITCGNFSAVTANTINMNSNVKIDSVHNLEYGTGSTFSEQSQQTRIVTPTSLKYNITSFDLYMGGSNASMGAQRLLGIANNFYAIPYTPGSWLNTFQQNINISSVSPGSFWLQYNGLTTERALNIASSVGFTLNTPTQSILTFAYFINPTVNGTTGLITGSPTGSSRLVQQIPANYPITVYPVMYDAGIPGDFYILGVSSSNASDILTVNYMNMCATSIPLGND